MATPREEIYSKLHPVLDNLVDIICSNLEQVNDIPNVLLEENIDEKLFINGKLICVHKHLYPIDVLNALDEYGIINFEKI